MQLPIVEFRPNKEGNTMTMYVNGIETNTWHRLPGYKYFNVAGDDIAKAKDNQVIAQLIQSGEITSDKWEMFDACRSCKVTFENIQVIGDQIQLLFANKIFSCQTHYKITPEDQGIIIQQHEGQQWTTQIISRLINGKLSSKIGIKFYDFGYSFYFLP